MLWNGVVICGSLILIGGILILIAFIWFEARHSSKRRKS